MNREISGWAVGWTVYAAMMMMLMGIWWAIAGLVAIVDEAFYVVAQEWIFEFDVTAWGWIHLILGVVVMIAGSALFRGAVWARTVGVFLAMFSGLVAFAWLPYYPIWAILFIAVSIAVIWSLTVHGRDVTAAS